MNFQNKPKNILDEKFGAFHDSHGALSVDLRSEALKKLEAFVDAVNARRGKTLTIEQADHLVNLASDFISGLN